MRRMFRYLAAGLLAAALLAVPAGAANGAQIQHRAYLSGYPDGTIRPETPLSREQLAAVLCRMMHSEARETLTQRQSCFADVPPDRWSYGAVTAVAELGLLTGDMDGNFHPEGTVSPTDLALVLNLTVWTEAAAEAMPELAAAWASTEMTFAAGNGWVMGYDGVEFRPGDPLTRGGFAEIFNNILDRHPASVGDLLVGMELFSDNLDTKNRYFLPVQEASVTHTACLEEDGERWLALG